MVAMTLYTVELEHGEAHAESVFHAPSEEAAIIHANIIAILFVGLAYCTWGLVHCWREGRRRQVEFDRQFFDDRIDEE